MKNRHAGRLCHVCSVELDGNNAHCANKQCPWCTECVMRRDAETRGKG